MSKNKLSRRSFFKRIPGLVVAPKVVKDLLTETPIEPPEEDAPEFDSSACEVNWRFRNVPQDPQRILENISASAMAFAGPWKITANNGPFPGFVEITRMRNLDDE